MASAVASRFGCKSRRLLGDVVSIGGQGTRDGREGPKLGAGTGAGTRTRTRAGMCTRKGIGARTGTGAGARIERQVEGRESLGTYEVVKGVGCKTREGGHRQRVTRGHSRKTDAPARPSHHAEDQNPGTVD